MFLNLRRLQHAAPPHCLTPLAEPVSPICGIAQRRGQTLRYHAHTLRYRHKKFAELDAVSGCMPESQLGIRYSYRMSASLPPLPLSRSLLWDPELATNAGCRSNLNVRRLMSHSNLRNSKCIFGRAHGHMEMRPAIRVNGVNVFV